MSNSIELLVDHPNREMICGIYTKRILETIGQFELGFDHQDIINDSRNYDFFVRTRRSCDVIVTPNYHVKRRRDILSRALRRGAKGIVVQHSEQFFSPLFYEEKFNLKHRNAYERQVAGHLVWGEDFARKLVERAHVSPKKIYIVGNPKLDLARRFQSTRTEDSTSSRPTVLIASDFNLGDYTDSDWEWFKRMYSVQTDVPLHEYCRRARDKTIEWVTATARHHPRVRFIVRSHPGERVAAYDALSDMPNIELSGEAPIGQDLGRATVVFLFTSSSLFEALAMGKPVFNLAVEALPEQCRPTYYDDLEWIDFERMNAIVEGIETGSVPEPSAEFVKRMERHVWNPKGNTLLTNAIGIHLAASRIVSFGEWSARDQVSGRLYYLVPALKLGIVKLGHLLYRTTGWRNPIYKVLAARWEERLRMQDFLSDEMIAEADHAASKLIGKADFEELGAGYTLRESPYGYYIDLTHSGRNGDAVTPRVGATILPSRMTGHV